MLIFFITNLVGIVFGFLGLETYLLGNTCKALFLFSVGLLIAITGMFIEVIEENKLLNKRIDRLKRKIKRLQ